MKKKFIFLIILIIITIILAILYFSLRTEPPIISVDDNGIPLVDYGTRNGLYIGKQWNPVTISRNVNSNYENYKKTGNETSKEFLINNANWLIKNAKNYGEYSLLEYNFPFPTYDMPSPWRSGMAQGVALKAMIKAHEVTNEAKYLEAGKLFLKSFFIEVKDGGVTYKTDDGWWYEEYAHENGKQPKVLNGMIYTVFGIYDFYKYTNDTEAKFLFVQGIKSLKTNLPKYDRNGYSYYDILNKPSGDFYHNVHLTQTAKLYQITNEEIFRQYHEKWQSCNDICKLWEYYSLRLPLIISEGF